MASNPKKRTLDSFFAPKVKKVKVEEVVGGDTGVEEAVDENSEDSHLREYSKHPTYPFDIPHFPPSISKILSSLPSSIPKTINNQPDLDLLYFQPYIPKYIAKQIFEFLRNELPFYRVEYKIKRGGFEKQIKTPRYTTVFGLDSTSIFSADGLQILDSKTKQLVLKDKNYLKYAPRPIPACLELLRQSTEAATSSTFNFCLVNYYASGADSVSYHSDDEVFLGADPAIASFSLGSSRDFLMKHKPIVPNDNASAEERQKAKEIEGNKPLKLSLGSGDCVIMRGSTQKNWLHSIPKRTGKNEVGGRINITFRKALLRSGTENYYYYNVGSGGVFKWDEGRREMVPFRG